MLGVLTADQLAGARFPLGSMTKERVREIAAARGFAVATKPDSHDICFIPDGDTRGFLARRLGSLPGPVVDAATGATVGEHDGTYGFTVGQRRGLGVAVGDARPRYVLGIEPVSRTVTIGTADLAGVSSVQTGPPTWTGPVPPLPFRAEVQLRAHGTPVGCEVSAGADGGLADPPGRPRGPPADRRASVLQPRHKRFSEPCGISSSPTGATPWSAWARGISPRRDRAMIRPRSRASSRLSTTSTMVSPVPISRTSPPLAAALSIASRPVAPRIVDEQLGDMPTRERRRLRRLVALGQRQRPAAAARDPSARSTSNPHLLDAPRPRSPRTTFVRPLASACSRIAWQIFAVASARHEVVRLIAFARDRTGEIAGRVGPAAHPPRGDIEEMRFLGVE